MNYKIVEVFEKGQKRYYMCGYLSDFSSGPACEIGPFIYKRSAVKCMKLKKMNDRIMMMVSTCYYISDLDKETIFEILENEIDKVGE